MTTSLFYNPKGVRFEDACKLTMLYGFEEKGRKGSHRVSGKEKRLKGNALAIKINIC